MPWCVYLLLCVLASGSRLKYQTGQRTKYTDQIIKYNREPRIKIHTLEVTRSDRFVPCAVFEIELVTSSVVLHITDTDRLELTEEHAVRLERSHIDFFRFQNASLIVRKPMQIIICSEL